MSSITLFRRARMLPLFMALGLSVLLLPGCSGGEETPDDPGTGATTQAGGAGLNAAGTTGDDTSSDSGTESTGAADPDDRDHDHEHEGDDHDHDHGHDHGDDDTHAGNDADNGATIATDPPSDPAGDDTNDAAPTEAPFEYVEFVTSKGSFVLELNREKAPVTVANFLSYVDDGFYAGTIFHRCIAGIVQCGGFALDPDGQYIRKETKDPIVNEANNGLPNLRGTISMARRTNPDSATSQFFLNTANNPMLNPMPNRAGYAVFGRVVSGMDVVDSIRNVPLKRSRLNGEMSEPVELTVVESASRTEKPAED